MFLRYDPFREFERLTSPWFDREGSPRSMPMDAYRQEDHLVVHLDLPGVFSRQVFLGEGLDADGLEAEYHDGVLTLRVPVLESARPRRVPIRMAEGGQQAIEAENRAETAA